MKMQKYLDELYLLNAKGKKLVAGVYLLNQLLECLEYIGGPTINDDWFNEVIVEPLKSIDFNRKTFKQKFDTAMREALGCFVSKELVPQFNVPEKTPVKLCCEFTLPANTKLNDPHAIWRHKGVQIEAEDAIISDVSANDNTRRLQCRLNLPNVLLSHKGKYDCILQLQGTKSTPMLTTTSLQVTPVNKTADTTSQQRKRHPNAGKKLPFKEGPSGEGDHRACTDADSS